MKRFVVLLVISCIALALFGCSALTGGIGDPFENFANIVIVSGSMEPAENGTYYLAKDPITGEIDTTTYPPYYYINSKNSDYLIYYNSCGSTGWILWN